MEEEKPNQQPQQQIEQEEKEIVIKQNTTSTAKIYGIENYKIDKRPVKVKKEEKPFEQQMTKLREINESTHLPKKSVYGVILIHQNNFPHLFIYQKQSKQNVKENIQLVGGKINNGEEPIEGLKRKMKKQLNVDDLKHYQIGELLGTFYRINYSSNLYPYLPSHVHSPKEIISLYMIHINESCNFKIAEGDDISSIPFFNLYNNTRRRR